MAQIVQGGTPRARGEGFGHGTSYAVEAIQAKAEEFQAQQVPFTTGSLKASLLANLRKSFLYFLAADLFEMVKVSSCYKMYDVCHSQFKESVCKKAGQVLLLHSPTLYKMISA